MVSGRLKVFTTLTNYRSEVRLYRRDEKGKIVKERDHLMDCKRYLIMSGMARGITMPRAGAYEEEPRGRSGTTGY
jgi:hypothetical protein